VFLIILILIVLLVIPMKCKNCSYQFDSTNEGNSRKRKCGMCRFGDSYSIRSRKEYERNLLFAVIDSQQQ
jgi:hypothetical protein